MAQVYLGWGLMALQGTRRLYESLVVTKAGSSPMSSIHWLVGLVFYADMGLSVWIQGSGAILDSWNGKGDVAFTFPSLISLVLALGLYTVGYVTQNQCHKYLAGLRKYTLPNEGWFRYIICPHYTSECLIYLGLSVATAPPDTFLVNRTVFLGLVFVVVNLGTTAHGTNKWYGQKFGADKVAGRWSMIPPIF
ncbi:3-oxo-5-alpha-steroid 4-dehydrogenase 3 / polyprenol reductase [Geosmithia morbida]|uniref:Polyprenal reductase n=1 Tax=Geosmithia morbida TaxID=1094350 RepID=A0A9P5CZ61_9HYPO|nr:3-oxo-5-alpha-steroid 4-dehydrogenase 3 / polyprenol reductase [Geosmithia morbida]KAF4121218.1 3-oxo-5-alpha-steroid 4-dehydrogenase 3 / polyprenol reductase [Geosmithia morbida]